MDPVKDRCNISVFSEPAIYQIIIQGQLSSSLLHVIDDMQIRENKARKELTVIGQLPDQTALMGLLVAIHELHYGILSTGILISES